METNGTLPTHLKRVRDLIDIIAMDIHLPQTSGLVPQWDIQEQFLRLAAETNLIFTKIVISSGTDQEEFL
ncbi:MAG: hypothetical protein QME42_11835, partial [bacterium]|nr:hypothetical protein [bacterium]